MHSPIGRTASVVVLSVLAVGCASVPSNRGVAEARRTASASSTPSAASSDSTTSESSTGIDPVFFPLSDTEKLRHLVNFIGAQGFLRVTVTGAESTAEPNGLTAIDVDVRVEDCAVLDPCPRESTKTLRRIYGYGRPGPAALARGQEAVVFIGPANVGPASFGGGDTAERVSVHTSSVMLVDDGAVVYGSTSFTVRELFALVEERAPWPDPALAVEQSATSASS
jgi:hypothetical protein